MFCGMYDINSKMQIMFAEQIKKIYDLCYLYERNIIDKMILFREKPDLNRHEIVYFLLIESVQNGI